MRVKNDIKEIEKVLHLDKGSTKHEGNFIFSGKLNGHKVMVITEPADEEQSKVNISSVEIAELPEEHNAEIKQVREDIKVIVTNDSRSYDCWIQGKVIDLSGTEYAFEAKVYNEGSIFGINNGRVSKLCIRTGSNVILNYDRGWDIKPETEHKPIYKALMKMLKALDKVRV